jgi:NAD(P)-dependent dehydrogenase (short-subunit alcohol dehydrogenase family)
VPEVTRSEFEGRVAVVTGGGSGIGRAAALRLAASGALVWIANRTAETGERVVAEIEAAGGTARFTRVDVSDEGSVIALFEAVGPEVHVLVNSAGTLATTEPTPEIALEEWERTFAVNARGTFLTCKHALPRMRPPHASIVNVASVAGMVAVHQRAAYCASKGAVIAFTRALAIDHIHDGIRVNCVCPGTIDSPWIERAIAEYDLSREAMEARAPLGRMGTPEEVADAIVYLASDRAAFTTGSLMVVDGGQTAV